MNFTLILKEILKSGYGHMLSIAESTWTQKPSPDKWSKKEILGHLLDSAHNNHRRFVLASLQDNLIFDGYDQGKWVLVNDYQSWDTLLLLNCWNQANLNIAEIINNSDNTIITRDHIDHNFDKICMNRIRADQSTSLNYLIWDYIFHLEHHLSQIIPEYEVSLGPYHMS